MKHTLTLVAATLALLAAPLAVTAQAENPQIHTASWNEANARFDAMQAELISLRSELAGIQKGGKGGKDEMYCCTGSAGPFIGYETVYLKPFFTEEIDRGNATPSYNYETTFRFIMGYRNECGLGIRARYWDADFDSDPVPVTFNGARTPFQLKFKTLDLEATQLLDLGLVELDLFGGARYAKASHRDGFLRDGLTFEGVGPTVGMEAVIPIGYGALALVGNARGSLIYGDSTIVGAGGTTLTRGDDDFTQMFETQIGVEYNRCTSNGGLLTSRAVVEAQSWGSAVEDPASFLIGDDDDTGLVGVAFRLMYQR